MTLNQRVNECCFVIGIPLQFLQLRLYRTDFLVFGGSFCFQLPSPGDGVHGKCPSLSCSCRRGMYCRWMPWCSWRQQIFLGSSFARAESCNRRRCPSLDGLLNQRQPVTMWSFVRNVCFQVLVQRVCGSHSPARVVFRCVYVACRLAGARVGSKRWLLSHYVSHACVPWVLHAHRATTTYSTITKDYTLLSTASSSGDLLFGFAPYSKNCSSKCLVSAIWYDSDPFVRHRMRVCCIVSAFWFFSSSYILGNWDWTLICCMVCKLTWYLPWHKDTKWWSVLTLDNGGCCYWYTW